MREDFMEKFYLRGFDALVKGEFLLRSNIFIVSLKLLRYWKSLFNNPLGYYIL